MTARIEDETDGDASSHGGAMKSTDGARPDDVGESEAAEPRERARVERDATDPTLPAERAGAESDVTDPSLPAQATDYAPPRAPPAAAETKTFDDLPIRIARDVDPVQGPTEPSLRARVDTRRRRVVLVASGLVVAGGIAAGWWVWRPHGAGPNEDPSRAASGAAATQTEPGAGAVKEREATGGDSMRGSAPLETAPGAPRVSSDDRGVEGEASATTGAPKARSEPAPSESGPGITDRGGGHEDETRRERAAADDDSHSDAPPEPASPEKRTPFF